MQSVPQRRQADEVKDAYEVSKIRAQYPTYSLVMLEFYL